MDAAIGAAGMSIGLALTLNLKGWSEAATCAEAGVALAACWRFGKRITIYSDAVAQCNSRLGILQGGILTPLK